MARPRRVMRRRFSGRSGAWYGWRATCLAWAGAHLVLGLPLNLLLLRAIRAVEAAPAPSNHNGPEPQGSATRVIAALALFFAATGFLSSALSAHLPALLETAGATPAAAVLAGALIGPAQVGARLVEAGLMARAHPVVAARLATIAHPLRTLVLALAGPAGAPAFALFYGAGNGVLTIVRGTLPLAVLGPEGYARRLGSSTPQRAWRRRPPRSRSAWRSAPSGPGRCGSRSVSRSGRSPRC